MGDTQYKIDTLPESLQIYSAEYRRINLLKTLQQFFQFEKNKKKHLPPSGTNNFWRARKMHLVLAIPPLSTYSMVVRAIPQMLENPTR